MTRRSAVAGLFKTRVVIPSNSLILLKLLPNFPQKFLFTFLFVSHPLFVSSMLGPFLALIVFVLCFGCYLRGFGRLCVCVLPSGNTSGRQILSVIVSCNL